MAARAGLRGDPEDSFKLLGAIQRTVSDETLYAGRSWALVRKTYQTGLGLMASFAVLCLVTDLLVRLEVLGVFTLALGGAVLLFSGRYYADERRHRRGLPLLNGEVGVEPEVETSPLRTSPPLPSVAEGVRDRAEGRERALQQKDEPREEAEQRAHDRED